MKKSQMKMYSNKSSFNQVTNNYNLKNNKIHLKDFEYLLTQ